jgi:CheY-like chemotaxis protein
VLCDASRITQVLVNLVGNAHKFTPEGGRVDIRGTARNGSVRIEVADTGMGIDKGDQEAIFDAFTQLGRREQPGAQGTGLGLAISKNIVQLHGGSLAVESKPDSGSTFFFDLPVLREESLLPAFVEDGWRLARSNNERVTLALLGVRHPSGKAVREILEDVRDLARGVFRSREDEGVLADKDGFLAFLLTGGESDGAAPLQRLAEKVNERYSESVSLEYGLSEFNHSFSPEEWLRLARRKLAPCGAEPVPRRRRRVLVVDDDETILGLITETLKGAKLDLDVQATTSGYDACVRFGEFEPDLVILDIHLQDIDGTEVFRSMRRGSHGSAARFLAISGLVSRIGEMMDLGCSAFLAKPFELSALVEKVADLLEFCGTTNDGRREASCL